MIRLEEIEKLSLKYQMPSLAIVREYCQHIFLSLLYSKKGSEKILFKGGTALKIIFQSPRFSEDLDFNGIKHITHYEIEKILTDVLSDLEFWGFAVDLLEAKKTSGGYLAKIKFSLYKFEFPIKLEVSFRKVHKRQKFQITSIKNDYIQTYTVIHLPLEEIIEEKISALLSRAKSRDWYDFYFFLHNQMLTSKHKKYLPKILEKLKKTRTDFKKELQSFLPYSHRTILRNFKTILKNEIEKYL